MVNRVGSSPLKVEQVGEEILCREGNPLSDLRESKSQMSRLASSIWQNCSKAAKPAITEAAIRVAADNGPAVGRSIRCADWTNQRSSVYGHCHPCEPVTQIENERSICQVKEMKKPATAKKGNGESEAERFKAYLASQPNEVRLGLTQLCKSILAAAPGAERGISYGIPAFRLNGRPLVWFAAFKQHCSFFPGAGAIRIHAARLKQYKISKGTVQFPHGKPPSAGMVASLVKARMAELQQGKTPVRKSK